SRRTSRQLGGRGGADLGPHRRQPRLQGRRRRHPHHRHCRLVDSAKDASELEFSGNGTMTSSNSGLTIATLGGIPQVRPGDDLCALLIEALEGSGAAPRSRDILVVTSKIVSKAEGRFVDLAALEPSERARELAQITRKDARLVE